LDDLCKNCQNTALCGQLSQGTCADCPDSIQHLAEKSCVFGEETCDYAKKLREKYQNDICSFREQLQYKVCCPRCLHPGIKDNSVYETHIEDLLSGAKIVAKMEFICTGCGLDFRKEV
jgi:hypothetical protein